MESEVVKEKLPVVINSLDYEKYGSPIGLVVQKRGDHRCKVLRIYGFNREKMAVWLSDGRSMQLSKLNGYLILNRVKI
jgi:hypothetical protein